MSDVFNKLEQDLADAKKLPHCDVCRKQSDGAKVVGQAHVLCGFHYDEWLRTDVAIEAFVKHMRANTYKRCWEIELP